MKKLFLLRGLPGSGKSSLAKSLGGDHFEADMYFVGEDKGSYEDFIQSLKQPKTPKWFVAEMERDYKYRLCGTEKKDGGFYGFSKLKTTTINDKTYLVGKYLYE